MQYEHYFFSDTTEQCERCGEPIVNIFVAIDAGGQEHHFGSTCINIVCGGQHKVLSRRALDAFASRKERDDVRRKYNKLLAEVKPTTGECPF